jgi:hypothetical protein
MYHVSCLNYRMICLYWRHLRALNESRIPPRPRFDLTMIPKFNSRHRSMGVGFLIDSV